MLDVFIALTYSLCWVHLIHVHSDIGRFDTPAHNIIGPDFKFIFNSISFHCFKFFLFIQFQIKFMYCFCSLILYSFTCGFNAGWHACLSVHVHIEQNHSRLFHFNQPSIVTCPRLKSARTICKLSHFHKESIMSIMFSCSNHNFKHNCSKQLSVDPIFTFIYEILWPINMFFRCLLVNLRSSHKFKHSWSNKLQFYLCNSSSNAFHFLTSCGLSPMLMGQYWRQRQKKSNKLKHMLVAVCTTTNQRYSQNDVQRIDSFDG